MAKSSNKKKTSTSIVRRKNILSENSVDNKENLYLLKLEGEVIFFGIFYFFVVLIISVCDYYLIENNTSNDNMWIGIISFVLIVICKIVVVNRIDEILFVKNRSSFWYLLFSFFISTFVAAIFCRLISKKDNVVDLSNCRDDDEELGELYNYGTKYFTRMMEDELRKVAEKAIEIKKSSFEAEVLSFLENTLSKNSTEKMIRTKLNSLSTKHKYVVQFDDLKRDIEVYIKRRNLSEI